MLLIDKWLTGTKNFMIGCNLYDQYGTNKALKNLFAKGETTYAQNLLLEALVEINTTGKRPFEKHTEISTLLPMPKATDNILQALEEDWKPKYLRMNWLRHKLDEYGEDNSIATRTACHQICEEILLIEKEVNQIWEKRDYYQANGRLPDSEEKAIVLPTNPLELGKFIETCKRTERRYRSTKETNPKHAQIYNDILKKYKLATGNDFETKN